MKMQNMNRNRLCMLSGQCGFIIVYKSKLSILSSAIYLETSKTIVFMETELIDREKSFTAISWKQSQERVNWPTYQFFAKPIFLSTRLFSYLVISSMWYTLLVLSIP